MVVRQSKLRIPRSWDDVTPEWMTAAIAARLPDARVGDVVILDRDDGTNRRARFGLSYVSGDGPKQVFLKAHAAGHRLAHLRNGNLFNEARLFAQGPELPLDHPLVYTAIPDYLRLDFLLVMEDITLRGADPRDATHPLSVEQVANGLRALARLHTRYWGGPGDHRKLRWIKTWKPGKGWQMGLRKRIPVGLQRGADLLPSDILHLGADDIVNDWCRYVGALARGPLTLLHGDAHIGNTYVLPNGEVGFLDWQVVRWGNWSQDVGYFMIGALTENDRRASERELLDVYRGALELPHGQLPSRDAIWAMYRASIAYGLAIWLSTLGTDGWQSRDVCLALVKRYATAFSDLDTREALKSLVA